MAASVGHPEELLLQAVQIWRPTQQVIPAHSHFSSLWWNRRLWWSLKYFIYENTRMTYDTDCFPAPRMRKTCVAGKYLPVPSGLQVVICGRGHRSSSLSWPLGAL